MTPAGDCRAELSRPGWRHAFRPDASWGATLAAATALFTAGLSSQPLPASAAKGQGAFTASGRLSTARADHTASLLENGKLLVAGGRSTAVEPRPGEPVSATAAAELYDAALGTWTPTGSMAAARTGHTASVLGAPACTGLPRPVWCGKVLVVGGRTPDGRSTASAELYDPESGSWRTVGALATARTGHSATVLQDGRVLVAGGRVAGGDPAVEGESSTGSTELYDPASESWSPTGSLGDTRYGHTATPLADGTVLAAGGRKTVFNTVLAEARDEPTAAAELYAPSAGGWSSASPLAVERTDHTASLLQGGKVLVAGGLDDDLNLRRSAEVYDPGAGQWTAAASMGVGHSEHTATVLADGRLLVVGGGYGGGARGRGVTVSLAEVYSPEANTWTYTGPLRLARRQHTATLLSGPGCAPNCGKVLVVGGALNDPANNVATPALASTELYDPAADTVPAPVTNLTARAISASKVTLTFSAPGSIAGAPPPARDYIVKQSRKPIVDERTFARARTLCRGVCDFSPAEVGEKLTLNVVGLAPRATYHYALKPRDQAGDLGPLSNAARATTPSGVPGRVRNLRARPVSSRAIVLSFAAAGLNRGDPPPAGAYVVKQSRKPIAGRRGFARARSLCGGVCRFTPAKVGERITLRVTDLRPRTSYHYAVRVRDADGKLGPTSMVRARTRRDAAAPAAVRALTVKALSATKLRLSFRAPGSDGARPPPADRYVIKQSRSPITTARAFARARSLCRRVCRFSPRRVGDLLRLTVTGLLPGTRYHFSVRAGDAAGNLGPRSESRSARTGRSRTAGG